MFSKKIETIAYGLLFVASLGLAYWASLPKSEDAQEKFPILSIGIEEIGRIEFESEKQRSVLEQKEKDFFWLTVESKGSAKKSENAEGESGTNEPESFRANDSVTEYVKLFSPLFGRRNLGEIKDTEKLKDYGLDAAKTKLRLYKSNGDLAAELWIGNKVVGGAQYYAYYQEKQTLTMLDGELIEIIEGAKTKLFQRGILSSYLDDFEACEIKRGDQKVQINKVAGEQNKLSSWLGPDQAKALNNVQFDIWLENIEKLRIDNYAGAEIASQLESQAELFSLTCRHKTRPPEMMVFKKMKIEGQKSEYWVTGSFLKSYAALSASRFVTVNSDVEKMLQAQ
ncbi:MAG: DUF4340 domain-containing protein [Oligoflexales bacterium]|nr:DUF4340 domain-containing protein [Oligoflexales bacterium]